MPLQLLYHILEKEKIHISQQSCIECVFELSLFLTLNSGCAFKKTILTLHARTCRHFFVYGMQDVCNKAIVQDLKTSFCLNVASQKWSQL